MWVEAKALWGAALLAAALVLSPTAAARAEPVVPTASGKVEGAVDGDITSFKGIPFAQPPIGPLRWRAPQAATTWPGVRATTHTGPACLQYFSAETVAAYGHTPLQAEDCLYLNLWAPKTAGAQSKLPVMVWIYGGGFVIGDAANRADDGAKLAQRGVVVVDFNYRLGRFGWFAHPDLTKEGGASGTGDFGLMDQIAALKWVRDNIAAFGGDPGNVTIFGVSAGGMSVNLLMTSPQAQGLFAKAITESGLGRIEAKPLAAAEAQGSDFAKSVGAKGLDDLRKSPAATVLGPPPADDDSGANPGPIVDGVLVPEDVDRAFAEGKQAPVPWIVGSNTYEASLFPNLLANPQKVFAYMPAQALPLVRSVFDPTKTDDDKALAAKLLTATVFTEPARFLAAKQHQAGAPVYRYVFGYVPEAQRAEWPGAGHGGEVQFVLGNLGARRKHPGPFSDFDRKISADMGAYWTNFAKTGDPNGPGLPAWPRDADDAVLVVDSAGEHVANHLLKPQLDLLQAQAKVH